MSVMLEFINLIIPIENIERVYPGGFNSFVQENIRLFGGRLWHDDFLFRDGAMNSYDIKDTIKDWKKLGLIPYEKKNGKNVWKDLCVIDTYGGLAYHCDWIEYDSKNEAVFLKSKAPGELIGPDEMKLKLGSKLNNTSTII